MKVHASLKHYTAYSVETNRAGIDETISEFDLHDTVRSGPARPRACGAVKRPSRFPM
jgi:hypothetical protein